MSIHMLVVDDEEPILFAIREYFTARGCTVTTAQELEEAEALVRTRSYDIVVADLRLTGSHGAEGLELIGYIREHSQASVILLTAYGSAAVEVEAYQRGVNAVLQKPTPLGVLGQLVRTIVGTRPQPRGQEERFRCFVK